MSYGTVMVGKVKPGMQQKWIEEGEKWQADRKVPGFLSSYTLLGDDGVSVAMCAIFESKELYTALADSPEQDKWWRETAEPLLDGDVTWTDGSWM